MITFSVPPKCPLSKMNVINTADLTFAAKTEMSNFENLFNVINEVDLTFPANTKTSNFKNLINVINEADATFTAINEMSFFTNLINISNKADPTIICTIKETLQDSLLSVPSKLLCSENCHLENLSHEEQNMRNYFNNIDIYEFLTGEKDCIPEFQFDWIAPKLKLFGGQPHLQQQFPQHNQLQFRIQSHHLLKFHHWHLPHYLNLSCKLSFLQHKHFHNCRYLGLTEF